MIALLLLALSLSAAPPECTADDECTFAYHCSCDCCSHEYPTTKNRAREEKLRCAKVGKCTQDCSKSKCGPFDKSAWSAVCRAGRCTMEKKAKDGGT